jgi:hypothetical protein
VTKIAGSGSGSISQRHGSADPDPDPPQNVMDPQHCLEEGGGGFGLSSGVLVNRIIGFLGVLHMEVFSQRLEQEFDAQASEHIK